MTNKRPPQGRGPWPAFYLVTVSLLAAALLSASLLDYMSSRAGGPSYFFRAQGPKKPLPAVERVPAAGPLAEALAEALSAADVPRTDILSSERPDGTPLLELHLSGSAYRSLAARAEQRLQSAGIQVMSKKTEETENRTEFLWDVRRGEMESARILFVCPPAAAPAAASVPEARGPEAAVRKAAPGLVALIMDDMGENLQILDDLLSLKEPLTISVLPYSRYAAQTARVAHENGLEVLLHLPLESFSNHDAMGGSDGMILTGMSRDEIVDAFEADFSRIPFVQGVNNHMGSKFTSDESLMRIILAPIKARGLFFVDSRTTALTVGYTEALRMGIPSVERDVFLDADADRSRIGGRLMELFQKARKNGHAVGICHPFEETIDTLKSSFHLLRSYNLQAVPVSRLVHR